MMKLAPPKYPTLQEYVAALDAIDAVVHMLDRWSADVVELLFVSEVSVQRIDPTFYHTGSAHGFECDYV